ncbi:MAG TPA: enoyl-CoA hydratase-related protein [Nocardioides sp.]|nr:enoyl-CoA hydratase-related protein [Nocardioides sp.]
MANLTREGDVLLLDLGHIGDDDDHRFSPERIEALAAAIDEAEATTGPAAIVTTAVGKFYSNGLEPERFTAPGVEEYLGAYQRLVGRLLSSPLPSVAALQGHCFAGGLFWALAHDQRVMRADRGFVCLPEVLLGMDFTEGMGSIVRARLSAATSHEAMTTGRRYGGAEAVAAGIVDVAVDADDVLPTAIERAAALAPLRGDAYASIKRQIYTTTLAALGR